jgi:CDP-diacylglycerol--serine O-phosphatidyltransferase
LKQHIPTIITAGNLICGFVAIQIGDFYWSPILLFCSFIFDGLDGLVARALNVSSEFGKQLDSLSDAVSFGVAPAYLYYLMAPDDSWECKIIPSVIVLAGTLRLARFNVVTAKKYFQGLPIPANALFYIGVIVANENNSQFFIDFFNDKTTYLVTPLLLSAIMLSFNLKMFSIKGMTKNFKDNIFHYITVIVCLFLGIVYKYESISYMVLAYICLSIIYTIIDKYFLKPSNNLN